MTRERAIATVIHEDDGTVRILDLVSGEEDVLPHGEAVTLTVVAHGCAGWVLVALVVWLAL